MATYVLLSDQTAGVAAPGANTDILTADVQTNSKRPVSRIEFTVVLAGVAKIKAVDDTGTAIGFNDDTALKANQGYTFGFYTSPDRSYNFQLDTNLIAIDYLMVCEVVEVG